MEEKLKATDRMSDKEKLAVFGKLEHEGIIGIGKKMDENDVERDMIMIDHIDIEHFFREIKDDKKKYKVTITLVEE